MLGDGLACQFQRGHGLLARNGRIILKELIQTFAGLKAIKQIFQRHTCSGKTGTPP